MLNLRSLILSQKVKLLTVSVLAAAKGTDPRTPAPPEDRVKGSDKNSPGSAATRGSEIEISPQIEKSLSEKVKQHNERHGTDPAKRVTIDMLKKVWRRGAGAFSSSHRPNVTSRQQWASARVNAFLYLVRVGRPKNPKYVTDFDLLPSDHPKSTKNSA